MSICTRWYILRPGCYCPSFCKPPRRPCKYFFTENLHRPVLIIITRNQVPFQLQRLSLIPVHHSPRVKTDLLFSQGIHSGLAFSGTIAGPIVWLTIFEFDSGLQPQSSVIGPTVQLLNWPTWQPISQCPHPLLLANRSNPSR